MLPVSGSVSVPLIRWHSQEARRSMVDLLYALRGLGIVQDEYEGNTAGNSLTLIPEVPLWQGQFSTGHETVHKRHTLQGHGWDKEQSLSLVVNGADNS